MSRLTQTIVIVAALLVGAAGSATAAKLITGKQIKNGTITKKDLKKGTIPAPVRGPAGPAGAPGKNGAPGSAGPAGKNGVTSAHLARKESHTISGSQFRTIATQALPAGTYAVRASFNIRPSNDGSHSCSLNSNGQIASTSFSTTADGERVALTLVGKVTAAANQNLLISCVLVGDAGTATNITMQAIRAQDVDVVAAS